MDRTPAVRRPVNAMNNDYDPEAGFHCGPVSSFKWVAGGGDAGLCLDEAVSAYLKIPKAEAADLIDFGSVYVRGRKGSDRSAVLTGGEEIAVSFPPYGTRRFYQIDPNRVIFRDGCLFIYDKEPGIPSQQTPYDGYNNVFAALLRHLASGGKRDCYAAIHNRLDRETSGVLVFSLDRKANEPLGRAFLQRRVKKEYLAWIEGSPRDDCWRSDSDIRKAGHKYAAARKGGGRKAETVFRVLLREKDRTLVLAVPLTGRTHQIRIHLAEAGHPVAGDQAYGAKRDKRLYLHAWRVTLDHPLSRKPLTFEAPVPAGWPVFEKLPEVLSFR